MSSNQEFEGLRSYSSMDEALTELWRLQDRVKELETFRANVASVIANWNADRCSGESAACDVGLYLRDVSP
jgi:hypothetical protein